MDILDDMGVSKSFFFFKVNYSFNIHIVLLNYPLNVYKCTKVSK